MKTIDCKGTIVSNDDKWIYDFFEIESVCPSDITKALQEANGDDVTIAVNSGGGDVFAANEIYYQISQYAHRTIADITGIAASAATIICCAADIVRGVPGMQYMIHNVSASAEGDYNVMEHTSGILKTANKTVSNVYRSKTGMSEEELLTLMNSETWMDADEALERGFVDEIIGSNGVKTPIAIYNSGFATILSDEVKKKVRNSIKNPNGKVNTGMDIQIEKNRLNLLRMKGENL